MSSRRTFIKQALGSSAALAASGLFPGQRVLGANDRIRIGLIGGGDHGQEILHAAIRCPNVEAVAVADVYTRRLEEVKAFVPSIHTCKDFRHLLEDKSIDAVLIATPQHQHALNFVPAIQAGKDVYQEKTMAFNPDHARRMKKAYEGSGRVVQVGIQAISTPGFARIGEMVADGKLGLITACTRTTIAMLPTADGRAKFLPTATPSMWIGALSRAKRAPSVRSAALYELALLLGLRRQQRV